MTYSPKTGDLWPPLEATLKTDGEPVDLTTAIAVTATVVRRSGDADVADTTVATGRACEIDEEPTSGVVRMPLESGDYDEAGVYEAEFTITWPGAIPQTVPSEGFARFRVTDHVDD